MDSLPWTLLYIYFMFLFLCFMTFIYFFSKMKGKTPKDSLKILKRGYWSQW